MQGITAASFTTLHYTVQGAVPRNAADTCFTLHTARFTLNIAHCTLNIAHWTLHTAHTTHFKLHTTYCTLHSEHTEHFRLHSAHKYKQYKAHYKLDTFNCILYAEQITMYTASVYCKIDYCLDLEELKKISGKVLRKSKWRLPLCIHKRKQLPCWSRKRGWKTGPDPVHTILLGNARKSRFTISIPPWATLNVNHTSWLKWVS